MKLNKETILKIRSISVLDADIRADGFDKYKHFNSVKKNYDFDRMKELWPEGIYFQEKNLEGIYGIFEGKFVVVFRGVDSIIDWIVSFLFCKKTVPYKNSGTNKKIKIHRGFYNDYLRVRDLVREEFAKSKKDIAIIHGHSKGGALATLCGLDLAYNNPYKSISAFAGGSPRVGNKAFVESLKKYLPNFTNFEYGSDVIPQVPPRIFGFESADTQIHVGPKRRPGIGTKKDHDWHKEFNALVEELKDGVFYS